MPDDSMERGLAAAGRTRIRGLVRGDSLEDLGNSKRAAWQALRSAVEGTAKAKENER